MNVSVLRAVFNSVKNNSGLLLRQILYQLSPKTPLTNKFSNLTVTFHLQ